MGASGWHYFTPYQEDVGQALEKLRTRVFASGDYYAAWRDGAEITDEELAGRPPGLRDALAQLRDEVRERNAGVPEPTTILEALERAAEDGTHSILDICGLSDGAGFATAFPMPEAVTVDRFGAARPTREQIEADKRRRTEGLGRWQCWYAVVYKDGRPDEIYFEGCSGD